MKMYSSLVTVSTEIWRYMKLKSKEGVGGGGNQRVSIILFIKVHLFGP